MGFATWSAAAALIAAVSAPLTAPAPADVPVAAEVSFSEVTPGGPQSESDGFFELHNGGAHPVDLSGWSVYRCDEEGIRVKLSQPEVDLRGVIIEPGGFVVAAHMGARGLPADAVFSQRLAPEGFGLLLISPDGSTADSVAVYPNTPEPTQSECSDGPNLPASLAFALGESWQRASGGWIRAASSPGAPTVGESDAAKPPIRIDEVTAAGPAGHGDDFVELRNTGTAPVALGGWRLYRCAATGILTEQTLQHRFAPDAVLGAGERFVIGGPEFTGHPDARTSTSLADLVSGVLLTTERGVRVDGVSVSSGPGTACQDGDEKLPATLDYRSGESWQRTEAGGFVVAPRTPGERNAEDTTAAGASAVHYGSPRVAISEVATDPEISPAPDGFVRRNYVELGNYGRSTADLSGWTIVGCGVDGFRAVDDLVRIPSGVRLAPGETFLAALAGTADASTAHARFAVPFEVAGAGVWVEDASGRRVDSVGIYHRNEMDESIDRQSPCTKGLALPTFSVDRLQAETYHRSAFSGVDMSDFRPGLASPGRIDRPATESDEPRVVGDTAAARVTPFVSSSPTAPGEAVPVLQAFTGVSAEPLTTRSAPGERVVAPAAASLRASDDGYDFPYVRMRIASEPGDTVAWSGGVVGRGAVRLSIWDASRQRWRELAHGAGVEGSGELSSVALSGTVRPAEVVEGVAELLVQAVPRADPVLDGSEGLADPADYDTAIGHITDTQYYSEAYPEVYRAEVGWLAENAQRRKIDFVTHTGDLIQSWVDPDQREARARYEFEVASAAQAVLDEAGIPNSVLPGNHDNKRGVTNDLFNEYFGPERYIHEPWYGGSFGADDNSANYSVFEASGARFLMLSLPYGYGAGEISWAEVVIAEHPDANVILSTHEHLTPKTAFDPARRSSSRWLSAADELWERVVAPNRNVVAVLSGHFHGLGAIVTEDAGGVAGHTVAEILADYQEFRTHTGERATGFQRLLQIDLAGGRIAVDTLSVPLGATAAYPYDYQQFVPDNGHEGTASNEQPWNILDRGLQNRYDENDDRFAVDVRFQYPKAVVTESVRREAG